MPSELGSSIGRFGLIAAGGYAFGPIGAAVGALLGGFLFGGSGPDIKGPRLGDLDVSSSTYGGVIPPGFGVEKVAGTMIWAPRGLSGLGLRGLPDQRPGTPPRSRLRPRTSRVQAGPRTRERHR
jgi:hypothetical protein